MNCRYCGAANPEYEHRCLRCGRRLVGLVPPPGRTSAVPAPAREAPRVVALTQSDVPGPRAPHQQSLFRVIPFEAIAPPRKEASAGQRHPANEAAPRPAPKRAIRRAVDSNQKSLDFPAPVTQPAAPQETAARSAVQCQALVASIKTRSMAVALDVSIVFLAFGVFLGVFSIYAKGLSLTRTTALVCGAAFALLLFFYKFLACLLAGRSPGVRLLGLRLLHFDGRPADMRQRLLRLASGCLSCLTLGIGFLWAVVDEEHLTFHDHITETFATPADPAR
jgi:uncharacterized RDD family membrane protein YckC